MRFRKLSGLTVFLYTSVLLLSAKADGQCRCYPEPSASVHFRLSKHVFVGRVVRSSMQKDGSTVIVEFEIIETWKQDLPATLRMLEKDGRLEGFDKGSEWLVYAFDGRDGNLLLNRGCCSRTDPLGKAADRGDFNAFRKMGERKKRILAAAPTK